jgi:ABC-type Fe3+ transport system substrate-binding protein
VAPDGPRAQAHGAADWQRLIDGARAEGEVNAALQSTWTAAGIRALEDAVEREFGVRVKVNFTPAGNYVQRLGALLNELDANVTPSFDLYQSSGTTSLEMLRHDVLEAVDWPALLPAGTPVGVSQSDGRLLVVFTAHLGAMYDPTVVSDADVPRSLKDLGNPRLRGKVMLWEYAAPYLNWVIKLGREETLTALRGAMRNGAVPDTYANEHTRFAAKEYPLVLISSTFYQTARARGIPARFVSLDFAYNSDTHVVVPRKVAHPNAAKLLAAVMAGPEGQRIADEQLGVGNRYYENSLEYGLEEEARAAGLSSFSWADAPREVLDLLFSPQAPELEREIDSILKGAY